MTCSLLLHIALILADSLPLHFLPLRKLPMALFTVIVFSYLREEKTGKGFYDSLRQLNLTGLSFNFSLFFWQISSPFPLTERSVAQVLRAKPLSTEKKVKKNFWAAGNNKNRPAGHRSTGHSSHSKDSVKRKNVIYCLHAIKSFRKGAFHDRL